MYKNVPVPPQQHKDILELKRILGFKNAGEVIALAIENFYSAELRGIRSAAEAANEKRLRIKETA